MSQRQDQYQQGSEILHAGHSQFICTEAEELIGIVLPHQPVGQPWAIEDIVRAAEYLLARSREERDDDEGLESDNEDSDSDSDDDDDDDESGTDSNDKEDKPEGKA